MIGPLSLIKSNEACITCTEYLFTQWKNLKVLTDLSDGGIVFSETRIARNLCPKCLIYEPLGTY